MRRILFILISVLSVGAWQSADAAPGGGGKADLTTNLQVIDSSSSPVVVGEVVGVYSSSAGGPMSAGIFNLVVALSPTLANAEFPLLVRVQGPMLNRSGATLLGSDVMYYTDANCSTTPYFAAPFGAYTPSGVVWTSTGATTTYQVYKPGAGSVISGLQFNSQRDPAGPMFVAGEMDFGICSGVMPSEFHDFIQAEATPYSFTLTPPFKLKNP